MSISTLLTPDSTKRPHVEAVHHLGVIYRVWQMLVLDLSVMGTQSNPESVTLLLKLSGATGLLTSLSEYVARAELESTISEVIHGQPTGMGPFQLRSIRGQYGELTAMAVAKELLHRAGEKTT